MVAGETLEQTKKGIMEILMGGVFPPETTIVHLLVAAADTRFSVTDLADTEINRIVGYGWNYSRIPEKSYSDGHFLVFTKQFEPKKLCMTLNLPNQVRWPNFAPRRFLMIKKM